MSYCHNQADTSWDEVCWDEWMKGMKHCLRSEDQIRTDHMAEDRVNFEKIYNKINSEWLYCSCETDQ